MKCGQIGRTFRSALRGTSGCFPGAFTDIGRPAAHVMGCAWLIPGRILCRNGTGNEDHGKKRFHSLTSCP